MTKAELQERNAQLVKECDKETDRADALARLVFDMYEAMDVKTWRALPLQIRMRVVGTFK